MRTGRPLRADVERPPCPRQHESRTLLDGHYRSPDGRFERPRYRCVDLVTGKTLHRFSSPTPRRHQRTASGEPHVCDGCERELRRNDSPIAARRFGYAIRDYADMLVRAGRGELYREISADVRDQLGRVATDGAIKGLVGKSASPAIHAIDVFAPLVVGLGVPEEWPAIVAIDALPLRARHRKKRGPKPNQPWWIRARKKRKRKTKPGSVVEKNAREWLAKDKKVKAKDRLALDTSINFAFGSLRAYSQLTQDAMAAGATELLGWLRAARSTQRQQLIKQIGYEAFPKSASGVEQFITKITAAVGSRRHHFTNVDRLNKLLGLVRNRVAKRGRVEDYTRLIREWVERRDGRVEVDWDEPMDSWTVRSLDLAIAEAELRRKGIQSARQAPAKAARYRLVRSPTTPSALRSAWRRALAACHDRSRPRAPWPAPSSPTTRG